MASNKIMKKVAFISLGVLLLAYVGFQIYYNKVVKLPTETVTSTKVSNSYETTGYIIRDEQLITNDKPGIAVYKVEDGQSVAKSEVIAELYNNIEDANAKTQIDKLTKERKNLEQLNMGSVELQKDLEKLNNQIYLSMDKIMMCAYNGNLCSKSEDRDNLLYMLNERQIVTGKTLDLNNRINQLDNQIDQLNRSYGKSTGTISSPEFGYFISYTDGYEGVFDYTKALKLTKDNLSVKIEKKELDKNVIGKIATKLNWYIACYVESSEAVNYKIGDSAGVVMPFATTEKIPVTVAAVNQNTKYDDACVVFECNYMSNELSKARIENIKISSNEYSGLRVSKSAIHVKDITTTRKDENGNDIQDKKQVQGVYVIYGKQLVFKQIIPIYTAENYVVCSENIKKENLLTDGTIKLYDEVVIGGKDLYDGKFI